MKRASAPFLRRRAALCHGVCGFILSVSLATAAVTSEPVGISSINLPAVTDTSVAVPFVRPAVFSGQVASIVGNTITVVGAPGWTPGNFIYSSGAQPNTYYVLIGSGALEGRSFTITGNGAGTLTVNPSGGTLAGLAAGDALRVVPYWTLGTLFPATATGTSFTATSDPSSLQTTLGIFSPLAAGINGAPAATYFFYSGAWRQTGQSLSVSLNDQIVLPGSPIRIRNAANSGVFDAAGAVVMHKLASPIVTSATVQQDNPIALTRPVPVTLDGSGLIANGAFLASPNALTRADLLMVTDNTTTGINKAPAVYYLYYNSGWRKLGQPLSQDFGSDVVFDSSKSVTLRTAVSDGATRYWINAPSY
jgi:uncharacterized protein (TIGR02597 family)